MAYSADSESMLRYPEQMQHDPILTDSDQKFMTHWFESLEEDEPPNGMLDINGQPQTQQQGQQGLAYADPLHMTRPFQPNYQLESSQSPYPSYYNIPTSINIPNNNFSPNPTFHNGGMIGNAMSNSFVHNSLRQGHIGVGLNGINGMGGSEQTIPSRRQRSPSPNDGSRGSIKRNPSRRKSVRESNDVAEDERAARAGNKNETLRQQQDDGEFIQQQQGTLLESRERRSQSGDDGEKTDGQQSQSSESESSGKQLGDGDKSNEVSGSSNGNASASTSLTSATTKPNPMPSRGGRSKKGHHELLTEAEKKANHIASEQKRRQNIRLGFDQLVEIVPTLSQCHRSEALILQKCEYEVGNVRTIEILTVEYIQQLLIQKNDLKDRVKSLQQTLGDTPERYDDSSSEGELDIMF
ncbi:10332_t:CDS:2 [Paraglomus brasilianum]|uniref:10332_t:CDS:1 n=1 Tax=Paraglomus brasilianum TaxID=144538 RepID=A0A9N9BXU9_9GLOM|nr:10332_t:CDS:2 [Paraglomus brasilianum]